MFTVHLFISASGRDNFGKHTMIMTAVTWKNIQDHNHAAKVVLLSMWTPPSGHTPTSMHSQAGTAVYSRLSASVSILHAWWIPKASSEIRRQKFYLISVFFFSSVEFSSRRKCQCLTFCNNWLDVFSTDTNESWCLTFGNLTELKDKNFNVPMMHCNFIRNLLLYKAEAARKKCTRKSVSLHGSLVNSR